MRYKIILLAFFITFLISFTSAGCCIDQDEGLCSDNSNYATCIQRDGQFTSQTCSQVSTCQLGCCILAGGNEFTSEANCHARAGFQGRETSFDMSLDRETCYSMVSSIAENPMCANIGSLASCEISDLDEGFDWVYAGNTGDHFMSFSEEIYSKLTNIKVCEDQNCNNVLLEGMPSAEPSEDNYHRMGGISPIPEGTAFVIAELTDGRKIFWFIKSTHVINSDGGMYAPWATLSIAEYPQVLSCSPGLTTPACDISDVGTDFLWKFPADGNSNEGVILFPENLLGKIEKVKICEDINCESILKQGAITADPYEGKNEAFRFATLRDGTAFLNLELKDGRKIFWFIGNTQVRNGKGFGNLIISTEGYPKALSCNEAESAVGTEESIAPGAYINTFIELDSQNNPHVLAGKGWANCPSNSFTLGNKNGESWTQNTLTSPVGVNCYYRPNMDIDKDNRAWITSGHFTASDTVNSGQGVWKIENILNGGTPRWLNLFHIGPQDGWLMGIIMTDNSKADKAIIATGDGQYGVVSSSGTLVGSGAIPLGATGEQHEYALGQRQGQDAIIHGVQAGSCQPNNPNPASYGNSLGISDEEWASCDTFNLGADEIYAGIAADKADPEIAYLAGIWGGNLVMNIWNGNNMIRDPAVPMGIDTNVRSYHRWAPKLAASKEGGAFICYTTEDSKINIKYISQDGGLSEKMEVATGDYCSIATDKNGDIHIAYVNGGLKYKKLSFQENSNYFCDIGPGTYYDSAYYLQGASCLVGEVMKPSGSEWCVSNGGIAEDGRRVPVADITQFTITTSDGWSYSFNTYAADDVWSGAVTATNVDGRTATLYVNEDIRRRNKADRSNVPKEDLCGMQGEHGYEYSWETGNFKHVTGFYEDGYNAGVEQALHANQDRLDERGITGEITSIQTEVKKYLPDPAGVGGIYQKEFCLDGKIHTVPCAGGRQEFCSQGQCLNNPWEPCLEAKDESGCNPGNCIWWNPLERPSASGVKDGVGSVINCSESLLEGAIEQMFPVETISVWHTDAEGNSGWINIDQNYDQNEDYYFCKSTNVDCILMDNDLINDALQGEDTWELYQIQEKRQGERKLIKDLDLAKCVPKIPGGTTQTCNGGTIEISSFLDHDVKCHSWRVKSYSGEDVEVDYAKDLFGHAGIFSLNPDHWREENCEGNGLAGDSGTPEENPIPLLRNPVNSSNNGPDFILDVKLGQDNFIDNDTIKLMEESCNMLGDCGTKASFTGGGSSTPEYDLTCAKANGREDNILCTLKFTCTSYAAPFNGDCGACNSVFGDSCNEYACASLGQNCEASERDGKTYCNSIGAAGPTITVTRTPTGIVPPFTPVTINVKTNKESKCKFDLNNITTPPTVTGSDMEPYVTSMQYDLGVGYITEHKVILYPQGQLPTTTFTSTTSRYELLTGEGSYNVYIRCMDTAGHLNNIAPEKVSFTVNENPDFIPPQIIATSPDQASTIPFNQTSYPAEIWTNEPAECKWSNVDTPYESMYKDLACSTTKTTSTIASGYRCTTALTGINTTPGESTDFYIRCKDQPNLTETSIYTRNTNLNSFKYTLVSSAELKIDSITPQGSMTLGAENNPELRVETSGGSGAGKAECKFKFNSAYNWQVFTNTYSYIHTQNLQNIEAGSYTIELQCEDTAENIATQTVPLAISIDTLGPRIIRTYNNQGRLKIVTTEPAICKYSNTDSTCDWNWFSTIATGFQTSNNLEHSTSLVLGKTYFIDCYDMLNNTNYRCTQTTMIV